MNQQNIENSYDTKTSSLTGLSFLELVQEMKLFGMDPKPFLVIAANDIFSRHGEQAITYAELILDQMVRENNPNGIGLWKELYCILHNQISSPKISIH
ncbi:MAG: hypothetical protein COB54_03250 [Alphaproteobacteria bacterium]|nr:MAG: hypothetical protein COB54_03250 [Alphaproteobacteria bacterium]